MHRLRQRAWPRGNDFRVVRLGLPNQVGSGGVAVTPEVTPPIGPPGNQPPTVPGAQPGIPGTSQPGTQPPVVVPPDGTVPTVTPAAPVIRESLGAKTGINLLGDLEDWGYPDNQRIMQASLTFNDLSVKEIRDLCTKLPPKIRAELQITLPPEGEQPQ